MFVPLQISQKEIDKLKYYVGNLSLPEIEKEQDEFYRGILSQVTKIGVIDGSNLSQLAFPFADANYDVFISYSHNDEDAALYLYAYLRKQGLKCFLDSIIWNSADDLLSTIDRKYSMADDNIHYDYKKRNFSTSHVHVMLSMAILEGIKRSECCIFIKSNNSVSLGNGITSHTLSPWIYEEISFAQNCKISIPLRYKKPELRMYSEGGIVEMRDSLSGELKISYNINIHDFQSIIVQDILNKFGTYMLDDIYKKYKITQNITMMIQG